MGIMASNTATDAAQADEKALQGAPQQEPGDTVLDEHQHPDAEPGDDDEYPEGGALAWLAIAGSFLVYFASFGVVNSFGFFQTFYQKDYLKNYSPSVISFIGTLQITLMYLSGSVAGALFDVYGSKVCQSIAFHRAGLTEFLTLNVSSVALPLRSCWWCWLDARDIIRTARRHMAAVHGTISPLWFHCGLRSAGE